MKSTRARIVFFATAFILSYSSIGTAAISGKNLLTGKNMNVESGSKGSVVLFMSATCPCSNSHMEIVKSLSTEFKDFKFVAVHSNVDEKEDVSRDYFAKKRLPFPVIQDSDTKLADKFRALKTPHAFLISASGEVLYKGGVTNSNNGEAADTHYLRDALLDVASNRSVKTPNGRTLGCQITRRKKNAW